jgi:hypothetical protein
MKAALDPITPQAVGSFLYSSLGERVFSESWVRAMAALSELRIVGRQPPPSRLIPRPRPKVFRSSVLTAADVGYLYSELECLQW